MALLSKKVAIIGLGPKGLYALDALCQEARNYPMQRFEIHTFEPSSYPGAGPIYYPHQPEFLLMNFPAQMIDAWKDSRGPDLINWLKRDGKVASADSYVPRAEVGRYLNWCYSKVITDAPSNINLTRHIEKVTRLQRLSDIWKVLPIGIEVDEVLITTGHQNWTREHEADVDGHIRSPFPTEQSLTMATVPPGSSVACKGFALTFIDTMLALSEGRDGVFTRTEHGYAYHASGDEPAKISPFSRTGRPMRAKVEAGHFKPPRDAAFWEARLSQFSSLVSTKPDANFKDDVWPMLQDIADMTLKCAAGTSQAAFTDWQGTIFDSNRCRTELHRGYEIAMGSRLPDNLWAISEAWRRCYPCLVDWISHRKLSEIDAALFRDVAAEMERLAFGPPAQNVGKLICLEHTGLVSLEHLTRDLHADVVIDATIPPSGAAALSAPLDTLLRDGHLSAGALGGIIVNERAQALVNGGVTSGLSVIGRTTEGSVLGNDTLSRSLHDLPERWANFIVHDAHENQKIRLEQTV